MWISVYKLEDMPVDMEQRHPLLFSSACLLATRHVPRITKATVHEMYLRVRRLVASVVFKTPPLDYEALQALAVLSMFTPTIQTAMPIDSWMVSGIAMNHGTLSFGLSGSDFNVSQETQAQLRRLRIWNALCLTNVQYVSSYQILLLSMVLTFLSDSPLVMDGQTWYNLSLSNNVPGS